MMSLVDLAEHWKQDLAYFFDAKRRVWSVSFLYARIENSATDNWGEGSTLQEAVKNYCEKIRGKKMNIGSLKNPEIKQVPNVLVS